MRTDRESPRFGARGAAALLASVALCACGGTPPEEPAIPDGAVTLTIVETDPASPQTVPLNRPVHVRVRYRSDRAVRIVAYPYRAGSDLRQRVHSGGSPEHPSGEGEVLAWFSFPEPATIDEIQACVETWQGRRYAETPLPVSFEWAPGAAAVPESPWVQPLRAARDALVERRAAAAPKPGPLWDLVVWAFSLSVPGYWILQVLAVRWRRGRARLLAWAPAVPMALLWIFVIVASTLGGNLAPLWLIFLSPVAIAYLVILLLATRNGDRPGRPR